MWGIRRVAHPHDSCSRKWRWEGKKEYSVLFGSSLSPDVGLSEKMSSG